MDKIAAFLQVARNTNFLYSNFTNLYNNMLDPSKFSDVYSLSRNFYEGKEICILPSEEDFNAVIEHLVNVGEPGLSGPFLSTEEFNNILQAPDQEELLMGNIVVTEEHTL